jgi:hypothetical protein
MRNEGHIGFLNLYSSRLNIGYAFRLADLFEFREDLV